MRLRGPLLSCWLMRYLVLSDIHANLPALEAVLLHAKQRGYDDVMFLGDAVGYYPQANEVIYRLIDLAPSVAILGNHDASLLELADGVAQTNRDASVVIEVLERQLTTLGQDSINFLRNLKDKHVDKTWEATHGALVRQWDYLASVTAAQANLELMSTDLLLVGHTHFPKVFAAVDTGSQQLWRTVTFRHELGRYRLPPKARVIANPGAVGQPRDQIPLAAYALFDLPTRTLDFHRVEFDVTAVQRAVKAAGYPEVLAARLALGR